MKAVEKVVNRGGRCGMEVLYVCTFTEEARNLEVLSRLWGIHNHLSIRNENRPNSKSKAEEEFEDIILR